MLVSSAAIAQTFASILSSVSSLNLPSASPSPFLLSYQTHSAHSSLLPGQSNPVGFITAAVAATGDCRQSPHFTIDASGRLATDDGEFYSTSKGIVSQLFVPTSSEGDISNSWQVEYRVLQWHNSLFLGGVATLCVDAASNSVEVYFLERTPLSCLPITLRQAPLSDCSLGDQSSSSGRGISSVSSRTSRSSTFASSVSTHPPTSSSTAQMTPGLAKTKTSTSTTSNGVPATTTTDTGDGGMEMQIGHLPAYGMAYNAYINPFNIDNDNTWRDDFASMGPSYFNSNSNTLVTCGIAQNINFYNDDIYTSINGYLPGQTTLTDLEHIAVVYHGLFVPPITGTYQFTSTSDDWGYVWFGSPTAEIGWNEQNWVVSNRAGGPTVIGLLVVEQAGDGWVVPTTILYANAGQRASCSFSVMFPNGTQTVDFSRLFVQPLVSTWADWMPQVLNASTCPPPMAYTDNASGDDN